MPGTSRTVMINFSGQVSGLVGATKQAQSSILNMGTSITNVGKMFTSLLQGNVKPLVNGVFSAFGKLASIFLLMPSTLLGLVNPMNIAHMAMTGFSDAISASSPAQFVADTRNMAPAMQQAVMSVRLLEPEIKNLYGMVEQGFWAGFSGDVTQLAQVYFPLLNTGLGGIGTTLGSLREKFVDFLLQPKVVATIQTWLGAFNSLGAPILNLVEALLPAMISLFTVFGNILTNFVVPAITKLVGWFTTAIGYLSPLISGVSSIFSGGIGSLFGGGSGSSSTGGSSTSSGTGFLGTILGGIGDIFGSLFGLAGGGSVLGGQSYKVGENGMEILHMGSAGHITPNSALGGDTHVHVRIGDTELRDIISHQVTRSNSSTALAARMGRGTSV